MLHVYRHVAGLREFDPFVLTQKRKGDWAVERIETIKRSSWRFLARQREKLSGQPWQISQGETNAILSALQREKAQILHIFFGNVAVHLLPLLRACPVPIVVSFHGSDVAGSMASPAYRASVEEVFQRATLVASRSEQLSSRVAALGCPPAKLRAMRTILPADIIYSPRHAPVDQVWRIVQSARLVSKKGLATALRSFAAFVKKYPWSTFTIAGDGPMEEELRGLVRDLEIDDRVEFTGFLSQSELRDLFAVSHIFLHPSETANGDVEGIPNAMLEAMASGLPVVATRHGGIPEVVQDGVNGLLCAERDVAGVTAALERLADDPALYVRLSQAASDCVREQFSAPRQIAAVEAMYREAINAPSPKTSGN